MRVYSLGPQRLGNNPLGSALTDENGDYSIRFFPGKARVRAYSPTSYRSAYRNLEVDVPNGEIVSGVDFEFQKGVSISGKVFGPDGQPLGGAIIGDTQNSEDNAWQGRVYSDDDGSFTLNGVKSGFEISLEARETKKQLRGFFEKRVSPENEIEIRLERYELATIEGRVFGLSGDPLRGIPMELHIDILDSSVSREYTAATTDSTGYYRIDDLIIGDDYSLYAKFEGSEDIYIGVDNLVPGLNPLEDAVQALANRWLEGTVTDSDGKPVSGAMVMVNALPTGYQHVDTDETGYYRLENLVPEVESVVNIDHKDYGYFAFESVQTNTERDFTLEISKYHLSGIVLDEDGNPIDTSDDRNIKVMVSIDPKEHESGRLYYTMQVGDNGKFMLENILDPVIKLRFIYNNDVYTFENVETNRDDVEFIFKAPDSAKETENSSSDIPLGEIQDSDEMVTVSGTVEYEGEPVGGAEIYVYYKANDLKETSSVKKITKTNNAGSFKVNISKSKLDNPEKTRTYIVARNPKYSFGWVDMVTETDRENSVIQVYRPTVINGTVSDIRGNPIRDVDVQIHDIISPLMLWIFTIEGNIPFTSTKTDEQGRFELTGIPENKNMSLMIRGSGYNYEYKTNVIGGSRDINIILSQEGRIEGVVRYGSTGQRAENITVMTQGLGVTDGWGLAVSDKEGRYAIENLSGGQYNIFIEDMPDFTAVAVESVTVIQGEAASGIDLKLVHGGFITGRVTEKETGDPIPDSGVGFYDAARPRSQSAMHSATTDENGYYRFRAAPGPAHVYISYSPPEGYLADKSDPGRYRDIVVAEGETVSGVDFQLIRGIEIKGRVITSDGKHVSGAIISSGIFPMGHRALSDKDGKFTFKGLEEVNNMVIKAEHDKLRLKGEISVSMRPENEIEIVMDSYKTAGLSGNVFDSNGNPMSGISITFGIARQEVSFALEAAISDEAGEFYIPDLIVGEKYVLGCSEIVETITITEDMEPVVFELSLSSSESRPISPEDSFMETENSSNDIPLGEADEAKMEENLFQLLVNAPWADSGKSSLDYVSDWETESYGEGDISRQNRSDHGYTLRAFLQNLYLSPSLLSSLSSSTNTLFYQH
ncbi:carboxypeptidase regulatory-like domain-containing protein, partial [Candidatus Latescibacterota bacterium]